MARATTATIVERSGSVADAERAALAAAGSPRISVIIVFLNAAQFLAEAVESVLRQTYANWELLLVDDGSTDASTASARGHALAQPGQVRYLEHAGHQNKGISAARNLGVQHASGDYVAFLDADDVWLPHALAAQAALATAHPEAGMLYGPTQYWHSWTGAPADRERDHLDFHRGRGVRPNQLVQPPDLLTHFLKDPGAVPSPCSVLVKRTVLNAVGGLDEAFRGLYEDQALYAKVATHAPVYVSGTHWARYRQHPASLCAVAGRLGQETAARRFYLDWLGAYLDAQGVRDPALRRAFRLQRARLRFPHIFGAARQLRRTAGRAPRVARRLAKLRRAAGQPAVGRVRFGDLRRLSPFSQRFGFERGQPIDRHYIEMFLARHQADVQGDVLEIGDDAYTRAYGGARVQRSDVLHLHADNPKATIVADLSRAEHLAAEQFDCIICTQTLQYIFDCQAAVRTLSRLLKPGGVVLATMPGLSQVGLEEWSAQRRWAFTDRSVRELFESAFPPELVDVTTYGNVLTAAAFLYGLAVPDLRPSELERVSSQYQLVIAVRAMKPAG